MSHTTASAPDGYLLGTVACQSSLVHVLLPGKQHETVQFHILRLPHLALIPGYPWLRCHNPHIDWSMGAIPGWSAPCHQDCLRQATGLQRSFSSSVIPDLSATSLPPHDLMTAPLTCSLAHPCPRMSMFPICSWEWGHGDLHKLTFGCWHHSPFHFARRSRVFLCGREGWDLALTTSPPRTTTCFLSSPLPLSSCRGPPSSQSLTIAMHIIWFVSERGMSGRLLSTLPQVTTNTM